MTTATLGFAAPSSATASPRRGELAVIFQEAFTVAVRLRANRQVAADAASFRSHIKQLLSAADRDARNAGYDADYVRMAVYAYIAFLDESVLNSSQPMFAEWPRQPLQEEVFGDHTAGETFFRHLDDLVSRQDSEDLADLLEIFHLCLLLGFRGRYGIGDPAGLHAVVSRVQDKIVRIRGGFGELSPAWAPPADEVIAVAKDPWLRRLGIAGVATLGLALLLFLVFSLSLRLRAGDIRDLAAQLVQ